MIRSLNVEIDRGTWPAPPALPAFPSSFNAVPSACDIDVTAMLLLVGHLTTPTLSSGVSLSELWACVRYYFAVTPDRELRLSAAFADLDSHQKTILSDDFGMGIPVQWLIEPLQLAAWCDGREFATRFNALTRAAPPKLNKKGPAKSPDFVFRDSAGLYHVVECKGTQSGTKARDKQLSHQNKFKQPSGAVVQKTMIKIKSRLAGQRLACGVAIAREGVTGDTHMKIQDPDGELTIEVEEHEEVFAEDAVVRAVTARALRAAGIPWSAAAMAAPSGATSGARPLGKGKRESARQALIEARLSRSGEELRTVLEERVVSTDAGKWVTRRSHVALPRPLELDGRRFQSVEVTEAVAADVLARLREGGLQDDVLAQTAPWLADEAGRLKLRSEGDFAELTLGQIFRSTMRLRQDAE